MRYEEKIVKPLYEFNSQRIAFRLPFPFTYSPCLPEILAHILHQGNMEILQYVDFQLFALHVGRVPKFL